MAYANRPHIHTILEPYGTTLDNKYAFIADIASLLAASGWEPVTVKETHNWTDPVTHSSSTDNGYVYSHSVATQVLIVDQQGEFDSFGLFASPPGATCDGLAVWSVHKSGDKLNLGTDNGVMNSSVFNCCVNGTFNPMCPTGACVGTPCVADRIWVWPTGDFGGQHDSLIHEIVTNLADTGSSTAFAGEVLWKEVYTSAGTTTRIRSFISVWAQGVPGNPVTGGAQLILPSIGAAYNSTVSITPGGWVMRSEASNTDENVQTLYFRPRSSTEDSFEPVTFYDMINYTPPLHPYLYERDIISGTTTVTRSTGLGQRTDIADVSGGLTHRLRLICNPYQLFMYQFSTASGSAVSNPGSLDVGALRTIPLEGENPAVPSTWNFRRATYHVGGVRSFSARGLYEANKIFGASSYVVTNGTATTTITSGISDTAGHLGVGGFHQVIYNDRTVVLWKSGAAQFSEPWVTFNPFNLSSAGPALGQLWDSIVAYDTLGGTGSPWHNELDWWFWDNEWWIHWQTRKSVDAGPMSSIAFRGGWFDVAGLIEAQPVGTEWLSNTDAEDVLLYNAVTNLLDNPLPWGRLTGLTLSTSTIIGGTDTATLTVTCTQDSSEVIGDHTKLVALHSPRSYLTFNPNIIAIGSGTTTGTAEITSLRPGLGGIATPIRASSIATQQITLTVNDS